jgi:hypothetical protein
MIPSVIFLEVVVVVSSAEEVSLPDAEVLLQEVEMCRNITTRNKVHKVEYMRFIFFLVEERLKEKIG